MFAAPEGERLDTPQRKAAIEAAIAKLKSPEFAPTADKAGIESVGDPFSKQTFSKDGRIAYAEAQFSETIEAKDRSEVVAVEDAVREAVAPAGVTAEFNGDAEFPPIEQGTQELLGLLMALIVLLIVFRTLVATAIPLALAIVALMTAFLLLFILAGLTDINTITPLLVSMIGLGVGIDYSLFIVTRFRQYLHEGLSPRDAAAEAGASAGRAVHLRRPHRRDLGVRARVLRPRLRHEARDRLGARRSDHRAHRELAAHRGAREARAQGRSSEGAVPASDRRLGGRTREDADRTLGSVRHGARASRCSSIVLRSASLVAAGTSALVRLGASDQGTQPTNQTARRAYDLLAEGFGPGFNGPIPIVVDVNGDEGAAAARLRGRPGAREQGRRVGRRAAVQRLEDGRDRLRDAGLRAAGRGDGEARPPAHGTTSHRLRRTAETPPSTSPA